MTKIDNGTVIDKLIMNPNSKEFELLAKVQRAAVRDGFGGIALNTMYFDRRLMTIAATDKNRVHILQLREFPKTSMIYKFFDDQARNYAVKVYPRGDLEMLSCVNDYADGSVFPDIESLLNITTQVPGGMQELKIASLIARGSGKTILERKALKYDAIRLCMESGVGIRYDYLSDLTDGEYTVRVPWNTTGLAEKDQIMSFTSGLFLAILSPFFISPTIKVGS